MLSSNAFQRDWKGFIIIKYLDSSNHHVGIIMGHWTGALGDVHLKFWSLSPSWGGTFLKVLLTLTHLLYFFKLAQLLWWCMEHKDIWFSGWTGEKIRAMWVLVNALSMETNANHQWLGVWWFFSAHQKELSFSGVFCACNGDGSPELIH